MVVDPTSMFVPCPDLLGEESCGRFNCVVLLFTNILVERKDLGGYNNLLFLLNYEVRLKLRRTVLAAIILIDA